jgi:hypothetical protein
VPQAFARILRTRGLTMRVGMEASGHARWFECLLSELQFELWIGGAAAVRTKWEQVGELTDSDTKSATSLE